MADVKLPVVGEVNKKALTISAAIAAVVVVIMYARRRSASSAATAAAAGAASSTDTSSASAAGIDPATGFAYGSIQDQEALAANNGGFSSYDPYAGGYGTDYGYDSAGYPIGSPQDLAWQQSQLGTTTTSTTPTTNAEWEQAAIADLEAGGLPNSVIADAEAGLPRYLAKLTLTSAQASAVQQAVGLAGEPPVGGPYAIRVGPTPPPGKHPATHYLRHAASGSQSLDEWARANHTSTANVEADSYAAFAQNAKTASGDKARFDTYLSHGSASKMPRGLVFYTEG